MDEYFATAKEVEVEPHGVVPQFFPMLMAQRFDHGTLLFKVPHTVIYKKGVVVDWFHSAPDGNIKREPYHSGTATNILREFLKQPTLNREFVIGETRWVSDIGTLVERGWNSMAGPILALFLEMLDPADVGRHASAAALTQLDAGRTGGGASVPAVPAGVAGPLPLP